MCCTVLVSKGQAPSTPIEVGKPIMSYANSTCQPNFVFEFVNNHQAELTNRGQKQQ